MLAMGDNSFLAWLICFTYLYLATVLFKFDKSKLSRREANFLLFNTGLLLLLGINKQLDLQTIIIDQFKYYAHQFGVYGYKNLLKKTFVIIVLTTALLATILVVKHAKALGKKYIPLILGWCLIFLFIALRVFYFEHHAFQTALSIWQYQEYFQCIELLGLSLIYKSFKTLNKSM